MLLAATLLLWRFIGMHNEYTAVVVKIEDYEHTKVKELEKAESRANYVSISPEEFSSRIQRRVSDLADESKVSLKGLNSRKDSMETAKPKYGSKKGNEILETSLDGGFSGELNNILDFLFKLKNGKPAIKVNKLSFRRTTSTASIQGTFGVVCSSPGWPRFPEVGKLAWQDENQIEKVADAFMPIKAPTHVPRGEIWNYKSSVGDGSKLIIVVEREKDPKKPEDEGETRELSNGSELCGWRVDLSFLVANGEILLHRGKQLYKWRKTDELNSNNLKFLAEGQGEE